MSNFISCPECQTEIEITEVMSAQLAAGIRSELQTEYAEKARMLAADRSKLSKLQQELEDNRAQFDKEVAKRIAVERQALSEQLRAEAREAMAIELKDRDSQLATVKAQLKAFETEELKLRKRARELEERAEKQDLEVARRVDVECQKVREAVLKQADERSAFRVAEQQAKIDALGKQLQEAQRKLEQGSQQTQGDVQEAALERILAEMFPSDVIERVGKGERGGDVLQHVFDTTGRECGVILWESKRTKAWNGTWIGKAIDDLQAAKATVVCIVSAVLPNGIEHLDQRSGVWVSSWSCMKLVAGLLRHSLLEVAQVRAATDGQHGKMELLYNYMASEELRGRLRGIVEPYQEMEKDLRSEMRAINARWKKRRKQLDRVMLSASGLYGDLQGIIGGSLPEIESMEMLALEADVDADEEAVEAI